MSLIDEDDQLHYSYINIFKNPTKLPINQIHIERTWLEIASDSRKTTKDVEQSKFKTRTEVLPALDPQWLPKVTLTHFETISSSYEEAHLVRLIQYVDGLDYLLKCNYHQFWCTILFEPSLVGALRSFLEDPVLPFQVQYLHIEYKEIYQNIYNKFLLVYERLLKFKESPIEYMPVEYGLSKLKQKQLLNLPIIITLSILYGDTNLAFINKLGETYFNDATEVEFLKKELDTFIDQNLVILETINCYINGTGESLEMVPISIAKRPKIFSLDWTQSVVSYLLSTVLASINLFLVYKPSIDIALEMNFPLRLPSLYVNIYKGLYELLDIREEAETEKELYDIVIESINYGRTEFIELFHTFVSNCLDKALVFIGDNSNQEPIVETYLELLTTALEEDYFISDYNATHNVATQNEMFESCCEIDSTRTNFIVSCINKLPRNKTLQELSKLKKQSIESVLRDFVPQRVELNQAEEEQPGPSTSKDSDVDEKIRDILEMFPHLGDGFILQCLEAYNFNKSDVIDAILEQNLPPHLTEIPFDSIRIPPEPEPEKPILAYKGKRPEPKDALQLLNDKSDLAPIKNLILEGIQYNYENVYDDEYDDRDDEVTIPVPDNPVTEEFQISNPNRSKVKSKVQEEEQEEDSDEEAPTTSNSMNFCEDPAVLRERREARYRARQPGTSTTKPNQPKDVKGNPKGQGQEKSTLLNRQKKNVNKSSRANHNRKSGADFKRSKGMF